MAAYHTICTACTTSERAMNGLVIQQQKGTDAVEEVARDAPRNRGGSAEVDEVSHAASEITIEACSQSSSASCHRVCAMCTKEPALPSDEDDGDSTGIDDLAGNRKLKLRDRRALERKLAKELEAAKKREKGKEFEENGAVEQKCDEGHSVSDEANDCSVDENEQASDIEDDLIKAVGGEDKLLTGEAYQKMLLDRAREGATAS